MQRKATKNTRGPNTVERNFQAWLKLRNCCTCGRSGPSIVDHCEGATFKHNKVLIGHIFCIPLCAECDSVKTRGSRRKFVERFGPMYILWLEQVIEYSMLRPDQIEDEQIESIMDWGR